MADYDKLDKQDYFSLLKEQTSIWALLLGLILMCLSSFGFKKLDLIWAVLYYTAYDVIFWHLLIGPLEASDMPSKEIKQAKAAYRVFQHGTALIMALNLFFVHWLLAVGFVAGWYCGGYDVLYCLLIDQTKMPKTTDVVNWMGWSIMGWFGKTILGTWFYIIGSLGLIIPIIATIIYWRL